uniref:Uncharacterized protein n=1 Tax=Arundo donax TaxID=35708 RepID=A0A0A9EL41_ARUDO
MVSLVTTLRGRLAGPMSATVVLAVGMK